MSMSWTAASFSPTHPPSPPTAPAPDRAAALGPPGPPAAPRAPSEPADRPLISPCLAVTVRPSAAKGDSSGAFPLRHPADGATWSTTAIGRTTSPDQFSAAGAVSSGGGCTATVDGFRNRMAALRGGGGDRAGQKNWPVERNEGAAVEESPEGFSCGVPSALEATAATASPSSVRRSGGGRSSDGAPVETEPLSDVFGEAEGAQEEESEPGTTAAVGEAAADKTSPNRAEQEDQRPGCGEEGGPTQVLCVPEIATRDTEECLGIQVRENSASSGKRIMKHERTCFRFQGGWITSERASARGTGVRR